MSDNTSTDTWENAAMALADIELTLGECIYEVLEELDEGDHATAGRDFGRGVAFASKLMRDRLKAHYEARESAATPVDASLPFGGLGKS